LLFIEITLQIEIKFSIGKFSVGVLARSRKEN